MTSITETGLAVLAGMYLQAADKITEYGYTPFPDYEGETGLSICGALQAAAQAHIAAAGESPDIASPEWSAGNLTEELETRLGAVLYLIGRVRTRTSIRDISDIASNWERGHYGTRGGQLGTGAHGYLSQAEAIALLKTAASLVMTAARPLPDGA
jgi:hypothetical protein